MKVRQMRLADQIRDVVAGCLMGGHMNDPRLSFVTVTAVVLSGDLQIAKIYFRTIDQSEQAVAQAQSGLERASSYFRRHLADALDVRRIPDLRYFYDETIEKAARVEELLTKI